LSSQGRYPQISLHTPNSAKEYLIWGGLKPIPLKVEGKEDGALVRKRERQASVIQRQGLRVHRFVTWRGTRSEKTKPKENPDGIGGGLLKCGDLAARKKGKIS